VTTADDETSTPETPASPPADRDAVVRDVLVVLTAFLVASVAVGLVWAQVVEPVTVTRSEAGLQTGELALSHRFDHDAWYSLLGGGAALLLGVGLTLWRRAHETATLVAVVLGALLAAWVSSVVGTATGPEAADVVLADARSGTSAPDQVVVTADAAHLAWPLAAVLGAVLVLWAPSGRDRQPAERGEDTGE
jgi:MFS superfamily sulfate permease-like transporter